MQHPVVAMLTDFGTSDVYVGVMKGVIAARCPAAHCIDITHEVRPQNVRQAAYLLRSAYRYFPSYTVFLVVVDPGVGTQRQPLAIKTEHGLYVGPDNGVFGPVLDEVDTWQAVVLWPPEQLSTTFHGRDLFAPAAATLASGRPLHEIGTPTANVQRLPSYSPQQAATNTLEGEVIHIDHFGNIITSIGRFERKEDMLVLSDILKIKPSHTHIAFHDREIKGVSETYAQSQLGDLLALIGSDGYLEIAVNQGNAAQLIGANIGDPVVLRY